MSLKIIDKYNEINEEFTKNFNENIKSKYILNKETKETIYDTSWIEIFEEVIPHIDNILRNPNRFIANEEEIVKIELARKTTVDSIKHLARNTSFIQSIDEKTGDVMPSKILNINKEEDYLTYENKLIYTLIDNMKIFIHFRKEEFLKFGNSNDEKNNKRLKYSGKSKFKNDEINIEINLETHKKNKNENNEYFNKILEMEEKILMLSQNEIYKILDKAKFALIRPPIKKTNRILKNPDFQYAMKLWSYIQDNPDSKTKTIDENDEVKEDKNLKKLIDENFMLTYLSILDNLENLEESKFKEKNIKNKEGLTDSLLEKLIFVNSNLSKEEIKDLVLDKYEKIKYKDTAKKEGIEKIFKKELNKALKIIKLN